MQLVSTCQILFCWMQFLYWKDKCILAKILVMLLSAKFEMSVLGECRHPDRELGIETLSIFNPNLGQWGFKLQPFLL